MSEDNQNFIEVARAIVAAGREKGYIDGPIAVIPALAETEKDIFLMIARSIKDFQEQRNRTELTAEEVQSLFTYVYAKAAETVYNWHCGRDIKISREGMFSGEVPITVAENILNELKDNPVADDMFAAFLAWRQRTEQQDHPLLPLLEALKWTYRIAVSFSLDLLGEYHE